MPIKLSVNDVVKAYIEPESVLVFSLKQWQSLILILRKMQLLARYAACFRRHQIFEVIPEYAQHHLLNAEVIAEKQAKQVFYEAAELQKNLKQVTSKLIFLKGAGYSLSGNQVAQGRTYADIDILVDKEGINQVEKQLSLYCWLPEEASDYDQQYYRQWSHEIPPMRHGTRGTELDIHHNIIPLISGRAPDVEALNSEVELTPDGFQILTKPAMTLHSLVHLFFNDDFKNAYRDLLDLHILMSANDSTYWQTLLDLANKTGFGYELFLACRYTNKLLSTDIPIDIMYQLEHQYKKGNITVLDYVFTSTLSPRHPLLYGQKQLPLLFAFIRGHWLKMPLHILCYHLMNKFWISGVEGLLGKGYLDKKDKRLS